MKVFSLLKVVLIALVPFFFYLNPFVPWPKDLIFEAAGYGNGILTFFDAQRTGAAAPCSWEHCSYLLGQISLMTVYRFFGVSTMTTILNTSILAFLTIMAVYFFTKKILGFWPAIISLLLFSGSLFFLMVIKTAYPFYGTGPLTTTLTILLFLIAHLKKKIEILYLAGLALVLVGLSGGQTIPLVLLILLSFLIWKIIAREKIFPIKSYFLTLFLALLVFLGVHALFPLVNNNKPFEYLSPLYRMLSQRGHQVAAVNESMKERLENANRLLKAFFIDMNVPRQGHQHFLAGRAMLPLPLSLFFLLGILKAVVKRKDEDKMLLLWTGIIFLFYLFFADFQIRYFVIIAPIIYILTAQGMVWLAEKINKRIFTALLVLILGFYLYGTYKDYYVVLPKQAFKLEQYEGQEEMANFVKNNYDPKETFIVMGNVWSLPPQNFIFYTWEKKYELYYWDYLLNKVFYTPVGDDVIKTNGLSPGEKFQVEEFNNWEKEKLKTFKKFVYIFGFYNIDLTPTREWLLFRQIRPYLQLRKIIFATNGLPQLGIYEENLATLKIGSQGFSLLPNEPQTFNSSSEAEVKSILFAGETEKPVFFINGLSWELPVTTYPSEYMAVVFGGKSFFSLNPSFSTNNFKADTYRATNVTNFPSASLVVGGVNQPSELVYQLGAPQPINKLNILFFPRIFHDIEEQNYLWLSFSSDDKNYQKIYELKSNGSAGWDGLGERQKRIIIYPPTKVVYLKFEFSSEQAQLSSSDIQTMSFEGEFDWNPQTLKILPGENRLWFSGGGEPIKLSVFF